jgi:hypothetical protein
VSHARCTDVSTAVALVLAQKHYFSVSSKVLSTVLFLGVISSLVVAGGLVVIQVGLTERRRQSELAKLRHLWRRPGSRKQTNEKLRELLARARSRKSTKTTTRRGEGATTTSDAVHTSCKPKISEPKASDAMRSEQNMDADQNPSASLGSAKNLPLSAPPPDLVELTTSQNSTEAGQTGNQPLSAEDCEIGYNSRGSLLANEESAIFAVLRDSTKTEPAAELRPSPVSQSSGPSRMVTLPEPIAAMTKHLTRMLSSDRLGEGEAEGENRCSTNLRA